jgi:RNA polymerase sigma-70 factor (ECF subfamily)
MHLTDEELVRRYKQGDEQAFETIYEKYYPPLMRFMTRMCGNTEDAQETLQDAFLSIFRYLGDFRGESSLKNWMYKVAARACWKSKAKENKTVPLRTDPHARHPPGQTYPGQEGTVVSNGVSGWGQNPEQGASNEELRRHIRKGVASMPYIYKIVLNLRDFEGFSTREVSQILRIKESTAKVRLHRARSYLREWLKEESLSPE